MTKFGLTPDRLRDSAKKYVNGSQQVTDVLERLSVEQEEIRENWDGNSFDSFDQQFQDLKPKIQQFSQLLEDINVQLESVAKIVEQTDQDIANQLKGV